MDLPMKKTMSINITDNFDRNSSTLKTIQYAFKRLNETTFICLKAHFIYLELSERTALFLRQVLN